MANFNPGDYPVVVKITRGYLWVSSPDLDVHITEKFEDMRRADQIGECILRLWQRMVEVSAKRNPKRLPSPSSRTDLFPKNPDDGTVSIGVAARMKGVSRDTLRRMHARGEVAAKATPGGHLRFRIRDLNLCLSTDLEEFPQS